MEPIERFCEYDIFCDLLTIPGTLSGQPFLTPLRPSRKGDSALLVLGRDDPDR